MKKLLLTITTLFLGLFTIASCDINNPKPDKVKETETTQGNENKENKVEDKEKEKENTEDKVEDKDKEKEPSTSDNGTTSNDGTTSNGEQPSNDGTTSNGEQPSTSDNKQEEPSTTDNGTSNNGETSNEVGSGESGSSESGITSDGRLTPEESARELAFFNKRYEIRKRLEKDSKLNNSPEGIALARTIAANWDMRYKTDLMGRPVDEFYLLVGSVERRKMKATHALNYGWEKLREERD